MSKYQQLNLFTANSVSSSIPPLIAEILAAGGTLAFSLSGGKDSQAALAYGVHLLSQYGWSRESYAIHADLGRIEWKQTPQFVKYVAQQAKIPLVIVRRNKGDIIDRWQERRETLFAQGDTKPFWSSAASRYCTKELKVQPIDKYFRRHQIVVCAIGLRAEESRDRAKKPVVSLRQDICTEAIKNMLPNEAWHYWNANGCKGRFALNWNIIHDWCLARVWEWCGTSMQDWYRRRALPDDEALDGWPAHPAYVLGRGNERLSCSFCVLGSENDLRNAIPYNRDTYELLVEMEVESGWTFQNGRSLQSLK